MAVPAVPAGRLCAEPLPRAHAAEKTEEKTGKRDRRDRAPASPASPPGAERAQRAETRERPLRSRGKTASVATGDEKTSGAGSRKVRGRAQAPQAAESAAAKEGGAAKAVKKKKERKKRAARTAESKRRGAKKGLDREAPSKPCHGPVLSMDRSGIEPERLELVDCKGKPREEARRALSLLARPWGTPRPILEGERAPARKPEASSRKRQSAGGKKPGAAGGKASKASGVQEGEIAPGVRMLDPGLLSRIDALARRYPGRLVSLVSGYRPQSQGSLHQTGRALDLRIAGVRNDELAAACRGLVDTGCGYYPNSSFVHVDVRAPGTGSVSWIDASGPGEVPRYVAAWPPPQDDVRAATEGVSGEDAEEVLRRERREKPAAAPEKAASAAPAAVESAVLERAASAVPGKAASGAAEKAAGAVPGKAAGGAAEKAASAVPEKAASAVPEKAASAVPEKAASAVPEKAAGGAAEKAAGGAL
ncbi:YcbK family protein [Sorangium sp. So ce887]|uniref:YcbK family protein n=1 Tax=Sorangium sp. So ce887 TaxID=3133324 RepID=UPI003F632720